MAKDKRYNRVKILIEGGHIKSLSDLLDDIPRTRVARDLGMHHQTFRKYITNPDLFTLKDAIMIASLVDVDDMTIIKLIYNQYVINKKAKRKR